MQKCARGEDKPPAAVSVPKLTGLHHLIVGGFNLHQNLELEEAGTGKDLEDVPLRDGGNGAASSFGVCFRHQRIEPRDSFT